MKIVSKKKILILLLLVYGSFSYAQPPAPPPHGLPAPAAPIDDNLFILFGIAILFGIYIIYRNSPIKQKTPN